MSIARLFTRRTITVDLYRAPAIGVSGQGGDLELVASDQVAKRWPATDAPNVVAAIPGLAAARVAAVIAFRIAVDVRAGDEIRAGARRYKVEGVGSWRTVIVAGVSEVLTP